MVVVEFFDDANTWHDDLGVTNAGVTSSVWIVCDSGGVAVNECGVCFDGTGEAERVKKFFFGVTIATRNGVGDFAEPEAGAVDELDALGFETFEEARREHVPTDDDGGFAECSIEHGTFQSWRKKFAFGDVEIIFVVGVEDGSSGVDVITRVEIFFF